MGLTRTMSTSALEATNSALLSLAWRFSQSSARGQKKNKQNGPNLRRDVVIVFELDVFCQFEAGVRELDMVFNS
jgi:hypothetical protein